MHPIYMEYDISNIEADEGERARNAIKLIEVTESV